MSDTAFEIIRNLFYLLAAALFIFGIKGLGHPRTAVRGNLLGAAGMLLAIVVTLVDRQILGWGWIIVGLVIGTGVGVVVAVRIQMTAMPQLVALFNGFGGIASAIVAGAFVAKAADSRQVAFATIASGIIGAVTFSGSVLAFAKLQGLVSGRPNTNPIFKVGNAVSTLAALAVGYAFLMNPGLEWIYWGLFLIALVVGVFLVLPIGGADMPVIICLLNSYSGLAAAATGFVISNTVLIIAGSLVGASGLILTRIMCVAMNRSLINVLFGVMAEVG